MVLAHFGLSHRPFAHGPDPAAYYPASAHADALAEVSAALADGEPVVLLTGDAGVGKTLLAHLACAALRESANVAVVPNCLCERRADLLQAVLYELGLPFTGLSEQELRLALTDFALAQHGEGRRLVIVLDEAQLLSPQLFEEIRVWGNLESPSGKAVQVLLIGQASILTTLEQIELAAFAQRLTARVRLEPFGERESAEYLAHQIRRAGGHLAAVFTDEARQVLAQMCHGLPRLLNQAARASMAFAEKAGVETVDVEAVIEATAGIPHLASPESEVDEPTGFAGEVVSHSVLEALGDTEPWSVDEPPPSQRFVFTPSN